MKHKHDAMQLVSSSRSISVSQFGGRVLSFSINSKNVLMSTGIQTGSTFWPAPQSLWGWPPPVVLDAGPYEVLKNSSNAPKISMRSLIDEDLGIRLEKHFTPIKNGFSIQYSMVNESSEILVMAPWEISRVAGGLTFYSADNKPEPHSTCPVEYKNEHYWYQYDPSKVTGVPKIFANNTDGWLANVNDGLLFLKRFPCINKSNIAPVEGEVEIYAHADETQPYVELEQQGEFAAIMPSRKNHWTVDWFLFELPSSVDVSVGSASLLEFVAEAFASSVDEHT